MIIQLPKLEQPYAVVMVVAIRKSWFRRLFDRLLGNNEELRIEFHNGQEAVQPEKATVIHE